MNPKVLDCLWDEMELFTEIEKQGKEKIISEITKELASKTSQSYDDCKEVAEHYFGFYELEETNKSGAW